MLSSKIKNKINAIWQDFYNENMAQTPEIVNQLTTLMFIKMLDDNQSALEAKASMLGKVPNQNDLIFKKGNYEYYEIVNEKKQLKFKIPYKDLRWKNFKNLKSSDIAKRIKEYVIPFIKDPNNKSIGQFSKYAKKYSFGFDDKERLLTSVVDKLSDPELDFTNIDLMGDVYEYMCGSGISGQYRTTRHIIDMAVELMKPKLGEKIIDPTMGTAGFLIESAKYIKDKQRDELLNSYKKKIFTDEMFYGCDNDTNMARIGYMNSILHGIKNPNLSMDSLLEDTKIEPYINKFDLVLANPPFSGSLVQSAINGKILTITKTTKTELLFVTVMDMLLKVGGRCMTIVPDGVLFWKDEASLSLRRELVNRQKLIAVISMPMGIFMAPSKKGSASKGAAIKTSFLIFEKRSRLGDKVDKIQTDKVWFYEMRNDGYTLDTKRDPIKGTNIPDIISRFNNLSAESCRTRKDQSFFVNVDEIIKNNYNLTFKKYKFFEKIKPNSRDITEIIKELNKTKTDFLNNLDSLLGEYKE